MVVGSNFGEPKLNLIFLLSWLWIENERVEENPSSCVEEAKGLEKLFFECQ